MVKDRTHHMLVDTMGLLLVIVITAASMSDTKDEKKWVRALAGNGQEAVIDLG